MQPDDDDRLQPGISSHWTDPNVKLTPVPLREWIESLPEPDPFVLTEWQRELLEIMYRQMVARDAHTMRVWCRHLKLVDPSPGSEHDLEIDQRSEGGT